MVISQYPHYLYVVESSEPTMDSKGDWTSQDEVTRLIGRCREETNGRGSHISGEDFRPYVFSSLVLCPTDVEDVKPGTTVIVTDAPVEEEGNVRIKGECAKFDRGYYHNRLWV